MKKIPDCPQLLEKFNSSYFHAIAENGAIFKAGLKLCRKHFMTDGADIPNASKNLSAFDIWTNPATGLDWSSFSRLNRTTPRNSANSSGHATPSSASSSAPSVSPSPYKVKAPARPPPLPSPSITRSSVKKEDLIDQIALLQAENHRLTNQVQTLQKTVQMLRAKCDTSPLTFDNLQERDSLFQITRHSSEELQKFRDEIQPEWLASHAEHGLGKGSDVARYSLLDYIVWMFAFFAHFHDFTLMAYLIPAFDHTQVSRKVTWVLKALLKVHEKSIGFLPKTDILNHATCFHGNKDPFVDSLLRAKPILIPDGSGIQVFNSEDFEQRKNNWCWFKYERQLRFFAVCTMRGHVVFFSDPHIGHMMDTTALMTKGFYQALEQSPFFGPEENKAARIVKEANGKPKENKGTGAPNILLGDQGYTLTEPPPNFDVLLTRSVEGKEDWSLLRGYKHLLVSADVAAMRSVIERVFGRIQLLFPFVRGPMKETMARYFAHPFMKLMVCLSNERLARGENLYVDED